MRTASAVSVNDDFASCEAGIAVRATDDEFACGVHKQLEIRLEQSLNIFRTTLLDPRDQYFFHIMTDGFQHDGFVREIIVLSGENDAVDAFGFVSFRVLYGNLRFGVGAQIGHFLAFFADGSEFLYKAMGQLDRQRHVIVHLVACVTEHHALVAGTLFFQHCAFHTLVNVRRLAVDGREYAAGFVVELIIALVVADFFDDLTYHVIDGDVTFGLHFAGADHQSGGDKRLACHFRLGILCQKTI